MKKIFSRLAAVMLCVIMALATVPTTALTAQGYPDDYSQAKLLTFWQQEAHDGLTNGEAVYSVDNWNFSPEHYNYGAGHGSYGGTWETALVNFDYGGSSFQFHFGYRVPVWMQEEIAPGVFINADGYEYAFPDLYGDLDLAGTNLGSITPLYFMDGRDEQTSTHIDSIGLDDCELLTMVEIPGQEHLERVSALRCPNLVAFTVTDSACRCIDFKTAGMEKSLSIGVIGNGSVGVEYTPDAHNVYAYGEGFVGWYLNGELISAEPTLAESVEGRLTAVFAGDADGDGHITTSDALMILRCSIGMTGSADAASMDVNADGIVDSADALCVMRLALGVL